MHRIIIAAIFLCSLAAPAHSTSGGPEEAETCTSLTLTKKETPAALSELGLQASDEGIRLRPYSLVTLAAPCAGEVRIYHLGNLLMNDGRTLVADRHLTSTVRHREDLDEYYKNLLSTENNPLAKTDGFISSYKARPIYRNGAIIGYNMLGIWKVDEIYEIRCFQIENGKIVGEVKRVLTSNRPIKSASSSIYPQRDLFLLLENPDQTVDAVAISWLQSDRSPRT